MRIIYSDFKTKNAISLVGALAKNFNWKPVSFINSGNHQKNINNIKQTLTNLSDTADFVSLDELRDFSISKKNENSKPLDRTVLEKLSKYESSYFSWFEDTTGWNFSYHERRDYYYDILGFWNHYLNKTKPDLIFFYTWPHLVCDYPLYLLAKKIFNIDVIYINPIPLFENRLFLSNTLENISGQFCEKLKQSKDNKIQISIDVKKFIDRLTSKKVELPYYITRYFDQLDKINLKFFFKEFFKLFLTLKIFRKSSIFYKKNKNSISDQSSKLNNVEYLIFRFKNYLKTKKLEKFYTKLCSQTDKENFILFLGNYQPEVLSNLIAGHDEDIINVVKQIKNEIPKSWKIYYKEHPNIFKGADKGALWRSETFFKKLCQIDGLRIIDYNANTINLVDQSRAVATISGTVGIEATIRGKFALVFGESWYGNSEGANLIRNTEDLKIIINKIQNNEKINLENVNKFLQIAYDNSMSELSKFDPRYYVKKNDISDDEMTKILKFIKNKYNEFKNV
jgi:hypothetical protein